MRRVCTLAVVAMVILSAVSAVAQGGKDHPLISRFPGSDLTSTAAKEFDEITVPSGRVKLRQVTPSRWEAVTDQTLRLEGKVTRLVYTNPAGRSSLEVFRSYQQALTKAGFETIFACSDTECADAGTNHDVPGVGRWCVQGLDCADSMRYIVARLPRQEGDIYVAVKVLLNGYSTGGTVVNVIERKPMARDLVKVNAEAMRSELGAVGHTPIYGVYFDTGKADIKPESDATLNEIARLLRTNAALTLHVVGHTDNVGSAAANMELSRQRAAAVVHALVTKYQIGASRLAAAGVGPFSPVATNRTEEGRSKNRRVELVEQ